MSDEFLPPSGRPFDDGRPLPEPDENGYGYYEVEEYSGDPELRPMLDPPLSPRTTPSAPVEEPAFGPPVVEQERADGAVDLPPTQSGWTRSKRVPFADRNWRIPLIGALVTAMVVLVSFILLLPEGGLEKSADPAVVVLRELPVKQWDEDLDGFSSAVAADDTSMYVVVVKSSSTELIAFDLASGDERWSTEVGSGAASADGSVSFHDDGLAVVVSATAAGFGTFVMVDPANGKIKWQGEIDGQASTAPTTSPAPTTSTTPATSTSSTSPASTTSPAPTTSRVLELLTIGPDLVIVGTNLDGGFVLSPVDMSNKQIGRAVSADAFFVVDDVVYLDVDRTLTVADPATLQRTGDFRFSRDGSIVDPYRIGDDLVLGDGEQIVRLDEAGVEKYSFDPEVGVIRALMPMNGDQVLVSSATRMRVVALNDAEAEATTSVRSGVTPLLIHEIEGDEVIVAFDGTDSAVAPAAMRVVRVEEEDFDQVSEIELTSSNGPPPVSVAASTAYTRSFGAAPLLIAFDLKTGERLWRLSLQVDDEPTVTSEGVIVLTREDDESVVGYFAKDE